MPHNRKISDTGKILCDSYSVFQVKDNVPPPSRDEYSLPGLLQDLQLSNSQEEGIEEQYTVDTTQAYWLVTS